MISLSPLARYALAERLAWRIVVARFSEGLLFLTDLLEVDRVATAESEIIEKMLAKDGRVGVEARFRAHGGEEPDFFLEDFDELWAVCKTPYPTPIDVRRVVIRALSDCLAMRAFVADDANAAVHSVDWKDRVRKHTGSVRPSIAQYLWNVTRGNSTELGVEPDVAGERAETYVRWLRGTTARPEKSGDQKASTSQPKKASGKSSKAAQPSGQLVRKGEALAAKYEKRLWSGFSRSALADLKSLIWTRNPEVREQSGAAWSLARWYAHEGAHDRALELVAFARTIDPSRGKRITLTLLEAECLIRLGMPEKAREVVEAAIAEKGETIVELNMALANTYAGEGSPEAEQIRLGLINRVFTQHGFAPLDMRDSQKPLSMGNIRSATAVLLDREAIPRVSVLMPVYNAAETLRTAIQSILDQTWTNVEIVVCDDLSTDNTFEVASEMASEDSRVIALRQERNQGAYAARNRGLEVATGDFITVHDGDDWSHPQKIETEVRYLEAHPEVAGVYIHWTRCLDNLFFTGAWRPGGDMITTDFSSLVFRRAVRDRLGGWDRVTVAGDTEFIWRIQASFGNEAVARLHETVPLAFALHQETSLTRRGPTHARTIFYGIRREYREMAEWWHRNSPDAGNFRVSSESRIRPFPAPCRIDPDAEKKIRADFLFIMDFNISGGAFISTLNYIMACISWGKSVAIFNWRRYDLDPGKPLADRMRALIAEGKVRVVVAEDEVEVDFVIVGYPVVLQHILDRAPKITYRGFFVVINQMATRLFSGGDPQYDPRQIRSNLFELFGTEGTWIPISGLVRGLMLKDKRYPPPHFDTWNPLIDVDLYCERPLQWRGDERKLARVGRHCRDHYTKWPSDPQELMDAFCADKPCDVYLLGGTKEAENIIGRRPENWTVFEFDSINSMDFLKDIDFFIHYPHEDYIEEFGRAVLEAMATGIPAILPPVFEQTFGAAALYAEPKDVWPIVEVLWADRRAYLERARIGREFVQRNARYDEFRARIERIEADLDRRAAENASLAAEAAE
jgi:glycosyltransferase involved in cell wall biosynthesis